MWFPVLIDETLDVGVVAIKGKVAACEHKHLKSFYTRQPRYFVRTILPRGAAGEDLDLRDSLPVLANHRLASS